MMNASIFTLSRRTLLAQVAAVLAACAAPPQRQLNASVTRWRSYAKSPYGQMHFFAAAPADGGTTQRPLVCLHQSPTSGSSYQEFQQVMAQDRLVLCPDTAGYGNSDGPDEIPEMADYGAALAAALDDLGFGEDGLGPVDVLGFHTGNYVAAELAVQRPDLVARLVMPGIPYYAGEERERRLGQYISPRPYFADENYVGDSYRRIVFEADNSLSKLRRHELYVSRLLSGVKSHFGFAAVAAYPADERLAKIRQPVLLPILNETLAQPTRNASRLLANHELIELPQHNGWSWFTAPNELAQVIKPFLESGPGPVNTARGSRRNPDRPWRHFAKSRYGQMHFLSQGRDSDKPPLLLLHQSPLSGRVFSKLQNQLAGDRWVLSPDTAGFGDSDGPDQQPTMADYGGALADAVDALDIGRPVDVFGFHTGSFVATEAVVQAPNLFRRVVLCGVPYYPASRRQEMQQQFLKPYAFLDDPNYVGDMYQRMVPFDAPDEERLFQLERFIDRMRAGPKGEWGPRAVFAYDANKGLGAIGRLTLLMTFDEVMAQPTREAVGLVKDGSFVELPSLNMMGFVSDPGKVAGAIRTYLDRPLS